MVIRRALDLQLFKEKMEERKNEKGQIARIPST